MELHKVPDQPPARPTCPTRISRRRSVRTSVHLEDVYTGRISRNQRRSVRGSVFLEETYKLGSMIGDYDDEEKEEEEEPQVHKGWLKMNPIAERKSE